ATWAVHPSVLQSEASAGRDLAHADQHGVDRCTCFGFLSEGSVGDDWRRDCGYCHAARYTKPLTRSDPAPPFLLGAIGARVRRRHAPQAKQKGRGSEASSLREVAPVGMILTIRTTLPEV